MVKVGDVLEGYEVIAIEGNQLVLKGVCTKDFFLGYTKFNTLFVEDDGAHNVIYLTPKPVYDGAFGESVEEGNTWNVKQNTASGRFYTQCIYASGGSNVFNTYDAAKQYADALNCLQIDLRKNSVKPVGCVVQWSFFYFEGVLNVVQYESLYDKLNHALPWYETKEEAEKHLADSVRIIKSLETMKWSK